MKRTLAAALVAVAACGVRAENAPQLDAGSQPLHNLALYADLVIQSVAPWSSQKTTYIQAGKVVPEESLDYGQAFCWISNAEGPAPQANEPAAFQIVGLNTELGLSRSFPGLVLSSASMTLMAHSNASMWSLGCLGEAENDSDHFTLGDLRAVLGDLGGVTNPRFDGLPKREGSFTRLPLKNIFEGVRVDISQSIPLIPVLQDPQLQIWLQFVQRGVILNAGPTDIASCGFMVMGPEKEVNPAAFSQGKRFNFEDAAIGIAKDDYNGSQVITRLTRGFIAETIECTAPLSDFVSLEDLTLATGSVVRWTYEAPKPANPAVPAPVAPVGNVEAHVLKAEMMKKMREAVFQRESIPQSFIRRSFL